MLQIVLSEKSQAGEVQSVLEDQIIDVQKCIATAQQEKKVQECFFDQEEKGVQLEKRTWATKKVG